MHHVEHPLLNICITRWVENIDGLERFSLTHPFLIKCVRLCYMETIVFPFIVMDYHQQTKKCTRSHESSGIF